MSPTWASPCGSVDLWLAPCEDVLPQIESDSVALTVTSPPYNLKKKWWDSGANGCMVDLAEKFKNEWYADELPEADYQNWQRGVIAECRRITVGSVCYNHKVRHAFKREGRTFHPIEWIDPATLWCEIIWDKTSGTAINCRRPTMADERVYVIDRPKAWHNLGLTTVWTIRPEESNGHPCPFPLELPSRLIEMFSDESDTVCDPFMGSGQTALAAIRLGRRFLGIEKEPKYFAIALRRIQESLGMEVREPSGIVQRRMFVDN